MGLLVAILLFIFFVIWPITLAIGVVVVIALLILPPALLWIGISVIGLLIEKYYTKEKRERRKTGNIIIFILIIIGILLNIGYCASDLPKKSVHCGTETLFR